MFQRLGRAFSIIEALLAIVVIIIAVMGILGMLPYAFKQIQANANEAQAYAAGQQFLDSVRAAVQDGSLQPTSTTVTVDGGKSFADGSIDRTPTTFYITSAGCTPVAQTTAVFDCTVTVRWIEQGSPKSVVIESYATKQQQ